MTLYTVSVLQKLRERLVLMLIVLLPFHAFLVTVGTRVITGPGHAPLPWLAGWKEMILGVVLVVAAVEIVLRRFQVSGVRFQVSVSPFRVDVADMCIVLLLILGIIFPGSWKLEAGSFLYGFKYTLFPLFLFFILRRVPWSERFLLLTSYFLLLVGAIVAVYGILTLFLPESFFIWLGYSDLHSLYFSDGPIAAFQKIEGTGIRRIQSTFSGPNQLGMWLLVPWSVALVLCRRMKNEELRIRNKGFLLLTSYFLLLFPALFLTFSRAAWIGAAVIVGVLLMTHYQLLTRWRLLGYFVMGLLGVVVIGAVAFPDIMLRGASSQEHWRRPMEAIRVIATHPFGLGLGSAGPASNRTNDPCVFLEEGADSAWAKDRPNLCVFLGDQQVQPVSRVCRCPFLPENWYLQVGVELGVLGMILFVTLVVLLIGRLLLTSCFLLLTFLGVSVAALFLHAWEDSAVAYTVWILLAITVPSLNGALVHRCS